MTKPNASAAAIKLARANQLDIGQIKGTGKGDQVTKVDVDNYIAERIKAKEAADPTTETSTPETDPEAAAKAANEAAAAEAAAAAQAAVDNGPTAAAEKKAEDEAAERAAETQKEEGAKTLEIARVRDDLTSVWWCPFCDNAQPGEHRECGGCGAERQGENLIAEVGEKVKAA